MTTDPVPDAPPSRGRRLLAWAVHGYTALGLVAAAAIASLIVPDGAGPREFRLAFVLMFAALVIDATDGTLARWVRVKEVLPRFDGRRLDDLIDFLNYTCLPLLLIWRAGLLPGAWAWWLLWPLLASAYGFSQTEAKTADGYFLGFPSYWNLVAFYLYLLRPPRELTVALLISFAALTLLPLRYLYPSQGGWFNFWTNVLGLVWGAMVAWVLLDKGSPAWLPFASLFFPAFYLIASWTLNVLSERVSIAGSHEILRREAQGEPGQGNSREGGLKPGE